MSRLVLVFVSLATIASRAWAADIFDRQSAVKIKQFIEKGQPIAELTLAASAKLKPLSANVSGPCLLIKTDDGNFTKALVSWGLRNADNKPLPVLLIERYATYRQDRLDLTAASGKDVMLFPGFGFNFDIGQVVPQGQGADIEFTEQGAIKCTNGAQLMTLEGSQLAPADPAAKKTPLDHDGVLAEDFSGGWKVNADGRWLGEWEIKVNENGRATGTFVSDESRNSYDLSGQIGGTPHNLKLEVFLANTQMSVDAYLWTKDKSMMAGTVTMTGRKFGFVASRVVDEK